MEQVKIFKQTVIENRESSISKLEKEINSWLADNPKINIVRVTQSTGDIHEWYGIVIVIFYETKP